MEQPIKKRKISKKSLANLKSTGRPRGCKNKFTRDVREMVLQALNRRGGEDFFCDLKPEHFAKIAAKLVPQVIDAKITGDMQQTVIINTDGEGRKNDKTNREK